MSAADGRIKSGSFGRLCGELVYDDEPERCPRCRSEDRGVHLLINSDGSAECPGPWHTPVVTAPDSPERPTPLVEWSR